MVEVSRSGGFAGRLLRWSVEVEDLPRPTVDELLSLLGETLSSGGPVPSGEAAPGRGPDRFRWRIRTEGGEPQFDLTFAEPGPEPVQRLVGLVRECSASGN